MCREQLLCGATVGWHLNPSACCRITGLNLARAPRNLTRSLAVAAHLHFTSLLDPALQGFRHVCVYVHVCVCVCMYVCVYMCVCVFVRVYGAHGLSLVEAGT